MRAVNFIKIDLIKSKMHVISMFLLGALGCVMASESGMIADIAYMLFVVGVMQGAVFVNDRKSDTGLLHLLPATDRDRVLGRTLTGFVLTLIGVINILGCSVVLTVLGKTVGPYLVEGILLFIGGSMIFLAVQNTIFYLLGLNLSKQISGIVHIIPAFLFLFPLFSFSVSENISILMWAINHLMPFAICMIAVGLVLSAMSVFISERIVRHKDFPA